MKTRVCRLYEPHDLRVDIESVPEPGPGEVLVRVGAGGICGSDLHYFHEGGIGAAIRVRAPIILGHEAAGTVVAIGAGVSDLKAGALVAINPSHPCGECKYCQEGLFQHCLKMRFLGSAMFFPHQDGAFRDLIVVKASQCFPLADHVTPAEGACAEPLAVCLHARNRAGDLSGKRVLVTGAGPIGSLCVAAAREGGASQIVVTDLHDATLAAAGKMGATGTINVAQNASALEPYQADKGYFDVIFECSAAAPALRSAILTARPQGRIVQVGTTGDIPVPINMVVAKEITWIGTQRFHEEYGEAVTLINSGAIDVKPIITGSYPLEDALAAFEMASDRSKAVKVQLAFA